MPKEVSQESRVPKGQPHAGEWVRSDPRETGYNFERTTVHPLVTEVKRPITTYSRDGEKTSEQIGFRVGIKNREPWEQPVYHYHEKGVEAPGGARVPVSEGIAAARKMAFTLASQHATEGARAVGQHVKTLVEQAAARRKEAAVRFVGNPRVGDQVVERDNYGMTHTYHVTGFVNRGKETLVVTEHGDELPLATWRRLAKGIRSKRQSSQSGQTYQEFEAERLGGAEKAAEAQQQRADLAARRKAALKARETYRRNKSKEWVSWSINILGDGTVIPHSGARKGTETNIEGISTLSDYSERLGYGQRREKGFQTTMPRIPTKTQPKGEFAYKVAYDRDGSEYVVRDNYGSYIKYLPTGAAAERVAFALAVTAQQGQRQLELVQATIGGWSAAEIERQQTRDWKTGRYAEYETCEVCHKPLSTTRQHSYEHLDDTVTVNGRSYSFGGAGLFLCPRCATRLAAMSVPDAYSVLVDGRPMPRTKGTKQE